MGANHEETAKRLVENLLSMPANLYDPGMSHYRQGFEDRVEKLKPAMIEQFAAALAEAAEGVRAHVDKQLDWFDEAKNASAEIARLKAENLRLSHGGLLVEKQAAEAERDYFRTKLTEAERERDEARTELARVQGLPEQEWAQVAAIIMQILAGAAKAGFAVKETDAVVAFDRGQSYVTRLRARLAEVERERDDFAEHEKQTHERLGAILGTTDSLEQCALRLRADRDVARAEIENIKTVEFPRRIEKISKGCLAKGRREGLERAREIVRRSECPHETYTICDRCATDALDAEIAKAGGGA